MTVNYEIGKLRQDRRMRITLLLCIGTSKKRIKTEIFVTQADLNRKGKIRNDSPAYGKVHDKMLQIEREYGTLDTFLTGEVMTASEAIEKIRHNDLPTFFKYAEKWLDRASMKGKKNYVTAIKNFRSFTKTDIPFSMFSHLLIGDYIYFLRDKPRAQSLYVSAIKKIYTDAEKDYNLTPFSHFRVDIPRQRRAPNRALDIDTIRRVFSYHGKTRRAILARDCAILSFCLCGTNSADLYLAPPIRNNTLSYNRAKTMDRREDNAHMELKIPKQIADLVKRYKGKTHAFIFHTMYRNKEAFNTNLNIGLKTIRDDLGLRELTFYAFRHSWASIARNELGIDKWTVHSALCHQDDDTAIDDIYIKKDFRLINEANKKVVDFIFLGT